MKIERTPTKFEPIVITLESQEDVNAMFNIAVLAGEHEEVESSGAYDFAATVAASLQDHITTVDGESLEDDDEEPDEIPTGN